ncbi:hypothetical protein MATL_G00012370 [Megalops atlanticus]|uniref:SEA domain-containing protein n=1 Tax=Megalops atlanticus TaxID=7932 RepID=A0A9D3TJQ8_MEGAT|nr:hypothetical protein MATL_G00012370 [Megalops atlanticus]
MPSNTTSNVSMEATTIAGQSHNTTTIPPQSTPSMPSNTTSNVSMEATTTAGQSHNATTTPAANTTMTPSASMGNTSTEMAPTTPSINSTSHPGNTSMSAPTPTTASIPEDTNHTTPHQTTTTGSNTTTVSTNDTSNTTAIPSTSSPTNGTNNATTIPITTVRPTNRPQACSSNPCPFDSICVEMFSTFTCRCLAGSFFDKGSCVPAKVFPGDLHLTKLEFTEKMSDTSSREFQETALKIEEMLRKALKTQNGYIKSTVLQLRKGSVIATVDNIYDRSSNATQNTSTTAINEFISTCGSNCGPLENATFKETALCQQNPSPCDTDTTECSSGNGGIASCTCKSGYISSQFSNTSCMACPSGQKAVNNMCVPCPFGYAGFNCSDSALLAVVVISCVLGGLLLILLLVFLFCCCRTSHKEISYNSPYPAHEVQGQWSTQQMPKIPRATANPNWEPTQLEMTESGSTRALVAKDRPRNGAMALYDVSTDDLRTFKDKNPSRYSYLVQGQDNPYFVADEERGTK